MRFDSNRAWQEATKLVSANRDVILALAGVFLVLPAAALSMLAPPPEPQAGADAAARLAQVELYVGQALPWLLGMALLQILGTLTILALFTDRSRPTVAEALKLGMQGIVPVIAAQLLAGIAFFMAAMVPVTLATLTGSAGLATVAVLGCMIGLAYVMTRISLVPPVVMVEQIRNPVTALARSWLLTTGNVWRLLLFYLLLLVGFGLIVVLAGGLADLALRLVLGQSIGAMLGIVISSALQAVMSVYFIAVYAAAHRQLAGPDGQQQARTFE